MTEADVIIPEELDSFGHSDEDGVHLTPQEWQRVRSTVFALGTARNVLRSSVRTHANGCPCPACDLLHALGDLVVAPVKRKPGPNEPCPCGSGKKYKRCVDSHAEAPAEPVRT